jgi:hypothetical protein
VAAPLIGPMMPTGYQAVPENESSDPDINLHDPAATLLSAQEAYTKRLLCIFEKERHHLLSIPRGAAVKALPPGTRLGLPSGSAASRYTAFKAMMHTQLPSPHFLAALAQGMVMKLLRLATQMLKRNKNLSKRYSAWVFGLLCRLGDVGTLDSDGVSVVRELGKKSVWVGIGFLLGEHAGNEDYYDDEGDDEPIPGTEDTGDDDDRASGEAPASPAQWGRRRNTSSPMPPDPRILESLVEPQTTAETEAATSEGEGMDISDEEAESAAADTADEVEAAKARLLLRLSSGVSATEVETQGDISSQLESSNTQSQAVEEACCPDANTRATIDMIVTIAGELYGQRDLLEFRVTWGGEMGLWGAVE